MKKQIYNSLVIFNISNYEYGNFNNLFVVQKDSEEFYNNFELYQNTFAVIKTDDICAVEEYVNKLLKKYGEVAKVKYFDGFKIEPNKLIDLLQLTSLRFKTVIKINFNLLEKMKKFQKK